MRDTFPLLVKTDFPPIRRGRLETLQANLGYRCNLTILNEQGQEDLAGFLAVNDVEIVASLPCYLEENVDGQHGARLARQCQPGQLRLSIGRGDATDSLKKLAGPPPEFLAP